MESDNRGVDPDGPGPGSSGPAHGGLESAVEACWDEPAGQALSRLREAGAPLLVVVDAEGNPQTVVPERTLAAAGPAQQVARCKPAWPAATFIQPASVKEARRLAARSESQPFLGHRTVVIENGQLAGVVPVPSLLGRPGRASRLLERVFWTTGMLIARVRYGRRARAFAGPQPPSASS
jgi:hypothetical protein